MAAKKQNGRQNTKLIITHSIFKLGAVDFSWEFILTFCKKTKNLRWPPKNKMAAKYYF